MALVLFSVITLSAIIVYQHSHSSKSNFPFNIYNGSLIDYNNDTRVACIWNQGFNLTIENDPEFVDSNSLYELFIFNIHSKNISVPNLRENEELTILNDTCISLLLESNSKKSWTIEILVSVGSGNFKISVIGDTQGFQEIYQKLIESSNHSFILHLGDITPFGDIAHLNLFHNMSKHSKIPIFSTPGNHDIKQSNSTREYESFFGISEYYFKFRNYIFLSLDSSKGYLDEKSFEFLDDILRIFPQNPKVIFTHIPIFDPREGKNHSFINETQPSRIMSMIKGKNVVLVLSGHIHYFNHTIANGTHFVISGGGGASLHEPNTKGGFHHIVEIEFFVKENNFSVNPIIMERNEQENDISIIANNHCYIYSLNDLQTEFNQYIGNSSFQNLFQNWNAYGTYTGVSIQDILAPIGGMASNQLLEIEARDGLKENYSYAVIYPNNSWKSIQGEMILAFSYNATYIPDWSDGYRIVFLAPDEKYSNEDCKMTSPPGEGYWYYPSAGYRWLKYVKTLRILSC